HALPFYPKSLPRSKGSFSIKGVLMDQLSTCDLYEAGYYLLNECTLEGVVATYYKKAILHQKIEN
ncbi:MAG: hypothetical protein PQJ59_13930, partial [Spirochaetales bacterium]|nr:hypothetical protein [Spirochaetales bacterium]